MEMTKEETVHLIEIYKERGVIWDPQHPDHYNKWRKENAWEEIGTQMGKPVEQLRKEMENLLAALRRERMKMKKSMGTGKGADQVYKSHWFAFEALKFIWDKNKPRPTLSTFQTNGDENESLGETLVDGETVGTLSPAVTSEGSVASATATLQSPQQSRRKRKKAPSAIFEDERLEKAFGILLKSSNKDDECSHFGNVVASKLRLYNDEVRCIVQNEIMNIFVRANRGYYTNPLINSPTQQGVIPYLQPSHFDIPQFPKSPNAVSVNSSQLSSPTLSDDYIIQDLI